ncbi:MAG: hypothetical protein WCY75_07015 [Sulfurimonadaceae bacterium]
MKKQNLNLFAIEQGKQKLLDISLKLKNLDIDDTTYENDSYELSYQMIYQARNIAEKLEDDNPDYYVANSGIGCESEVDVFYFVERTFIGGNSGSWKQNMENGLEGHWQYALEVNDLCVSENENYEEIKEYQKEYEEIAQIGKEYEEINWDEINKSINKER